MQDRETLTSELGTAKKWQELVGFGRKENNAQPFVIELGIRVNKLQILRKDNCIEIKPKEWLDKKNWREINEILVRHGFSWLSLGKDSCWLLSKE
jgi:hypothetical protein